MCTLAFSKIFKVSNIITFSFLIVIVMYLTKYDFRIENRYQQPQSLKYENKGFPKWLLNSFYFWYFFYYLHSYSQILFILMHN